MRKAALAALTVVVLLVPATVWAGNVIRYGTVDSQIVTTAREPVTTTSTTWEEVPDLWAEVACPAAEVATINVSLAFAKGSAPVQIRVRNAPISLQNVEPVTAPPGVVPMSPSGADTRSFTFSTRLSGDGHGRFVTVEWRSATGAPATVWARSMHIVYDGRSGTCL